MQANQIIIGAASFDRLLGYRDCVSSAAKKIDLDEVHLALQDMFLLTGILAEPRAPWRLIRRTQQFNNCQHSTRIGDRTYLYVSFAFRDGRPLRDLGLVRFGYRGAAMAQGVTRPGLQDSHIRQNVAVRLDDVHADIGLSPYVPWQRRVERSRHGSYHDVVEAPPSVSRFEPGVHSGKWGWHCSSSAASYLFNICEPGPRDTKGRRARLPFCQSSIRPVGIEPTAFCSGGRRSIR